MSQDREKILDYLFGSLPSREVDELENQWQRNIPANTETQQALEVVDELAKAVMPMQPGDHVKKQLLTSIQSHSKFDGFMERLCKLFDLSKEAVEKILQSATRAPQEPWQNMGLDGIFLLHFDGGPKRTHADCGLVYIESGSHFPCHRHLGDEYALILQGEILENDGEIRRPGDQVLRPANSQHALQAIGNKPAIAAVVLNTGFEFIDSNCE